MRLPFDEAAEDELDAAACLLERERPGHELLLLEEVKRKVAQAADLPRSGEAFDVGAAFIVR